MWPISIVQTELEILFRNYGVPYLCTTKLSCGHTNTLVSLLYLCIKNETMAPLHVATLTVKKRVYLSMKEVIFSI